MSKKLAEGIDALVLDVKVGTGAFMKTRAQATTLATTMVQIGRGMGKEVVARLTAMDEPIGRFVGNSLEVIESLDVLEGRGPADTIALTVELGAEMLVMGKAAKDLDEGRAQITRSLRDGSARERFGRIIEAQHGDRRVLDDRSRLPTAPATRVWTAPRGGRLIRVDSERVGKASMQLGGGRARAEDAVDHRVGLEIHARLGDRIEAGQPLVTLHHAEVGVEAAVALLAEAYVIDDGDVTPAPLFIDRITA
jgi:pyrimidine-nucleoside phosphorylase/thymidine phosphorylase